MKLRTLVFAAVAAAAALALAGCGSPTDGSAWRPPGANGGNGENGDGDDGLAAPEGMEAVFQLSTCEVFQALAAIASDDDFEGTPFQFVGGADNVEYRVVPHRGRSALGVRTATDWSGLDIRDAQIQFAVGDVIMITGVSVSGGISLNTDNGGWTPLQGWQPAAAGAFSWESAPLTAAQVQAIQTNTAHGSPPGLRLRGSAGGNLIDLVIHDILVARDAE